MTEPHATAESTPGDRPDVAQGASHPRWWWALVVVIAGVVLVTRLAGLDLSLWWDEAFTAQRYIRGGPSTFLDPELYFANNHLLFTVLAWATSRLLGTSEMVLRLWAVLPALAGLAMLVAWLWRRHGPLVATVALTATAVSPLALANSIQARGYGLVLLSATVLLVVPVVQDRAPTLGGDLAVTTAGAVGMLSFPPVVALYLAHAGVWLLRRGRARWRLVMLTAAAGVVTAAVYLPLLDLLAERADRVGSRFADPITWWSPVIAPLQLVGGTSFALGRGEVAVWTLPAVTALVLGLLGLVAAFAGVGPGQTATHDRPLGWHLLAGLGGTVVLLAPAGFHLAERYVSFLLPHAVTAMALGLVALVTFGVSVRRRDAAVGGGPRVADTVPPVVLAAILLAWVGASLPGLWWSATTPLQAFAPAAEEIRAHPDADVVVDSFHSGYQWYLDGIEVERITDQDELDQRLCAPDGPVIFARHPDTPPLEVPDCLGREHERRFTHQRDPGYLSLWVVEPSDRSDHGG